MVVEGMFGIRRTFARFPEGCCVIWRVFDRGRCRKANWRICEQKDNRGGGKGGEVRYGKVAFHNRHPVEIRMPITSADARGAAE